MDKSQQSGPFCGKVTNNNDPEKLGRVKVQLKHLGDEMETDWCDVMCLYSGSFFMPEVDDQMIVAFLDGNLSQGVVLGSVWTNSQKPPESGENSGADFNKDGKNAMKYLRTKGSNRMVLDDTAGDEKIHFVNAMAINKIELLAKKNTIQFFSLYKVAIDASKKLTIKADKVKISMGGNFDLSSKSFKLKAEKDLTIKAKQMVKIEGEGGTISDHVKGKDTKYISASQTKKGTAKFDSGNGLVEIDIDKATDSGTGFVPHKNVLQDVKRNGSAQDLKNAKNAEEVLFKGEIPYEAITII